MIPAWYEEIAEQIRQGRLAQAKARVRSIEIVDLEREEAVLYATLCRRSGLPEMGIRALHKIIRPSARNKGTAKDKERIEYAACLIRVEALDEALTLLSECEDADQPEVALFTAFVHLQRWDFDAAIPCLEKVAAQRAAVPYLAQVAEVNWASALIKSDRNERASALLETLRERTFRDGNLLLYSNALALSAENEIARRRFGKAQEYLRDAETLLDAKGSFDLSYIEQWKTFIAIQSQPKRSIVDKFKELRYFAQNRGDWEDVRNLDYLLASARRDQALLSHLYFGTPYSSFRKKVALGLTREVSSYDWTLETVPNRRTQVLTLATGEYSGASLKAGQVLHRLLNLLAMDYYKPIRSLEIYARLFPDQYFNPTSAPTVVHQSLRRLRAWLNENEVPLRIVEKNGRYSLKATAPIVLRKHSALLERNDRSSFLAFKLEELFKKQEFTSSEASRGLGVSQRVSQYELKELECEGLVERRSNGPKTTYRLVRRPGQVS